MNNRQFKNLYCYDKDKNIYRILPVERLIEMLQKKQLIMPQINCWDDPYENFFLRSKIYQENIEVQGCFEESQLLYGQCWSLVEENDAMWRIYSFDTSRVMLKTTISKLFQEKQHDGTIGCEGHYGVVMDKFIGKVKYITPKKLLKWKEKQDFSGNLMDNIIDSLYLKREYFRHEKEVRVIYSADSEDSKFTDPTKKLIGLSINPFDLIEEVKFDPRGDKSFYDTYSKLLIEKLNFPKDRISKSTIYEFTPLRIDL